jgi:DNA-binding MarR family transcriptional regulator
METDNLFNDGPLPALIRSARGAFAQSIRQQLVASQIYDLPRNGAFMVGGLYRGEHAGKLFHDIGLREGPLSRLLQALLERGFVEAGTGEAMFGLDDLQLTEKGRRAAQATARGVNAVTQELTRVLSVEQFAGFRAGLLALIDIKDQAEEQHALEHEHERPHVHPHEHD